LRTRNRYLKLVGKIDSALKRIEDGSYGLLRRTGDPIGHQAPGRRPIATMTSRRRNATRKWKKQYTDENNS